MRLTTLTRPLRALSKPKRLAVIIGAAMALIGSGGQFFFVDAIAKRAADAGQAIARRQSDAETLKNAQLQYFMTYQQGSMIYAMNPDGATKDKQVLANLYKLNLINRATPLRSMLGEMAMAGLLDYRTAYDGYVAVNEKAREDFSWENYAALNAFERKIVDDALAYQHKLQQEALDLGEAKAALDATADQRKLTLVLVSMFGSFLLLVANLKSA